MKTVLIALLSWLLIAINCAVGQTWQSMAPNDPRIAKLTTELGALKSIQGNMTQTKTFSFMDKPLVSNGLFRYSTGNRLRWEFTKPSPYCILIDGDNMRLQENRKEKDLKSVDRVMRQVKEVIVGCINGKVINNPAYEANAATNGTEIKIGLKPKDRKLRELIAHIEMIFGPTGTDLRSVKLTDPSGDATRINFDSIKVNEQIPESTFKQF